MMIELSGVDEDVVFVNPFKVVSVRPWFFNELSDDEFLGTRIQCDGATKPIDVKEDCEKVVYDIDASYDRLASIAGGADGNA